MDKYKSWFDEHLETRSFGQKLADIIAKVAGSWLFVIAHVVWFAYWIIGGVEPFPYGLLTMIVSLEAIFLSTFILISQNRQSEVDRKQIKNDYKTNVEAKKEIEDLMRKLDNIEEQKINKILEILSKKG